MDWINGHKTYIVAIGAVLYALGSYLTGSMDLATAANYLFVGAGAAALRHAMPAK